MLALVAVATVLVAMPVPGGASGRLGQIDKTAVVRVGVPIEDNGGVYFDPGSALSSSSSSSNRLVLDLIYDTMIRNTADGKGAPGLATKWSAPDASTVELTLRDGVKFSDGTPFNAAAVKAAWDRVLASGRPNLTPNAKAITSVETVGDNGIRLRLSQPVAQSLIDTDLRNASIFGVPSPAAAAAGTLASKPVGAGPYQLENYTTGKLTLAKNPTFYDPKSQKAGGFEFDQVSFGTPSVNAIQSGTVDIVWQVPPDSVEVLQSQKGLEVFSAPSEVLFVLNLCPTTGPFASKTARQAMQYALDRKSLNEGALAGTGAPAATLLTPANPYYNKSLAKTYGYNPKKARAMFKEAGLAEGTTIRAMAPSTAPYPVFADIVKAQLEDVGLDAQFTLPNDIGGELLRQVPEMSITVQQPSLFSLALGGQRTALNVCGYKNDSIVSALTTANDATKTPTERQAAWDTLQKLVQDESTVIPLTTQGVVAVHTDKLEGLEVVNSPWGPQLDSVYLTK